MRTIKFRYAWKRKSDGYIYTEVFSIDGIEKPNAIFKGADLWDLIGRDQWIGLVDKKGREIYENDYIIHPQTNRPDSRSKKEIQLLALVKWMDGKPSGDPEDNPAMKEDPSLFNMNPRFYADVVDKELMFKFRHWNWSEFSQCEIVGSIYDAEPPKQSRWAKSDK